MNRIAIDLGPIQIYWYSIFIFLGMLTACVLIFKESKKQGIEENILLNLIFYTIIIGIIGARAYYVLFNLPYYLNNPIQILEIWNGGLAIHGGIIAGMIFLIFYCKKKKIKLLKMLDIIVVGLIIAQAIGRWGNFFNGEAYGPATTFQHLKNLGIPEFIINGMYILGEYHHPTFLYESLWCTIGFIVLLLVRKFYKKLYLGDLTGLYLVWYGVIRFIIEGMRTDSLMLGPLKMAQIVSIIFIVSGIIIWIKNRITKKKELYHK